MTRQGNAGGVGGTICGESGLRPRRFPLGARGPERSRSAAWRRGSVGPVTPAVEEWIGERFRQQPDVRLREFQQQVGQAQGLRLSIGVLWLVLRQMGTRLKKSLHAQEQDTPEAQRRRQAWRKAISGPDPAQLVFLDEIGASIYIRQNYGRAPIERPLA
jgi:hypothetical protein